MAAITINIPDAVLTRVLNAYTDAHGFDVNKQPSETRGQFAKRMLAVHVKAVCAQYESQQAAEAAGANANTSIDIT